MNLELLLKILKAELNIAKENQAENQGGMKEFLETLEDSDMFYNEAYSDGAVNALKKVLKRLNINDEASL